MSNIILPNSFQTPNHYVDVAMHMLTSEEYKCLSFAVRHILGWQDKIGKRRGVISLAMFEHGFVTSKGVVFEGTGLTRPTIIRATDELTRLLFLLKIGDPTPDGQEWELGDEPDFDGLKLRYEANKLKRSLQTTKARDAKRAAGLSDIPGEAGLSDIPGEAGLSDIPEVVKPTNQQRSVQQTGGGLLDKQNQIHVQTHPQNQGQSSAPDGAGSARSRNLLFDAVAAGHGITDVTADGGRIAMIANWLAGTYAGKGARRVGLISAAATPEHVEQFFKDWAKDNPGVTPPMDFVKFVEHWRKWASKRRSAPTGSYFPSLGSKSISGEEHDHAAT